MLITLDSLIKKYKLNIKGIFHLGAHLLEEKSDYDRLNVSNVIWIEGNPDLCEIDKKALENVPSHKILNYLISDTNDEKVEFKITNNGQSSSILNLDKHKLYYPNINVVKTISGLTTRPDTIIELEAIDINSYNFINLDLQGVELKALKGFGKYLKNIDYIYTEVNTGQVYARNDLLDSLDEYLSTYGFERKEIKMTDAEWGDAFYIKKVKTTKIVMHILPTEIDDLEKSLVTLQQSSTYLEPKDIVDLHISLNVSDKLTNWETSIVKKEHFIFKFNEFKSLCKWANSINFELLEDENNIFGTTGQKRHAIKENYDQFIFLDPDIAFHPVTLKYILDTGYQLDGNYIITPQTVRISDESWDIIVNDKFMDKPFDYWKIHDSSTTYVQNIENVTVRIADVFKIGCGWFTLYSKNIMDMIGIPEFLGHYGSEDTFIMYASALLKNRKININQYILDGIYVNQKYIDKSTAYNDYIVSNNFKNIFYDAANVQLHDKLKEFIQSIDLTKYE
jgi:FkbM family methyltransferase